MHKITMQTINRAMWAVFAKRGNKNPPTITALCRCAMQQNKEAGHPVSEAVRKASQVTGGYITPLNELNTLEDFIKTGSYTKKQGA
jgi:hypothetical protein